MTGLASQAQLRMSFLRYSLVAVPLVLLLGTVSGRVSGAGSGNGWFEALEKPSFMPPDWTFAAVWTILYILLGLVLAMLLHARGARRRPVAIALFLLQLLSNYLWPPVFFGMHELGWALILLLEMILLTVLSIVLLWWIRRVAALLMLPYLAWLCFAALLTASLASLNPDASEVAPRPASTDILL